MFERYTEASRRAIFFARFEASRYGSTHIGTEHLLLGLLREMGKAGIHIRFSGEWFRAEIEKRITIRPHLSTSVEIPLSNDAKHALDFAIQEADAAKHSRVAQQHLLLGILRVESSMAAQLLRERGVTLEEARKQLADLPGDPPGAPMEDLLFARGDTMGEHALRKLEALLEGFKAQPVSLADFFDKKSQFIDLNGRRWVGPEIEAHAHEIFVPYAARGASYRIESKRFASRILVATILWQTPSAAATRAHHRMTVVMGPASRDWAVVSIQLTPVIFP